MGREVRTTKILLDLVTSRITILRRVGRLFEREDLPIDQETEDTLRYLISAIDEEKIKSVLEEHKVKVLGLGALTIRELQDIAREYKITKWSSYRKDELVQLLTELGITHEGKKGTKG